MKITMAPGASPAVDRIVTTFVLGSILLANIAGFLYVLYRGPWWMKIWALVIVAATLYPWGLWHKPAPMRPHDVGATKVR